MSIFNFLKKRQEPSKAVHMVICRCGHKFEFDWSKLPDDVKTTYIQCPNCHMELKIGNPKHFKNNEKIN